MFDTHIRLQNVHYLPGQQSGIEGRGFAFLVDPFPCTKTTALYVPSYHSGRK